MAERKESSVLVHLQELKGIEEKRVQEEEEQRRQREQERVRAQTELEQRARAEEEARRQAIIRAEQEKRDNEARRLREEQLKVAAAQRLATVHEEHQQEAERLSVEMEALAVKASTAKPVALSIVAVLLLGAVGYLGVHLYEKREEAKARAAEYERRLETIRVDISRMQRELDGFFAERRAVRDKRIRATIDEAPAMEKNLADLEKKILDKKAELRTKKGELSNPNAVNVTPTPSPKKPAEAPAPATAPAAAPVAPAPATGAPSAPPSGAAPTPAP